MAAIARRRAGVLLLLSLIVLGSLPLRALDVESSLRPSLLLPTGAASELFDPGGGIHIFGGIKLGGILAPGLDVGLTVIPLRGAGSSALLATTGLGLKASFFPLARLRLDMGLSGGAGFLSWKPPEGSLSAADGRALALGACLSGGFGLGYRLSPAFSLALDLRYDTMLELYSGISLGLGLELSLGGAAGARGLDLQESQEEPILPFKYWSYGTDALGTVTIVNRESAEIRDVKVGLSVPGYESGPVVAATKAMLPRGASFEAPLLAAFDENVLNLTEATRIQAVLTVGYRLLDSPRETKKTVALRFENRNALPWQDDREAAAFASPQDPAVLDLSKYVAGLVRGRSKAEIPASVTFAAGFFEAMRLSGMVWDPDSAHPFLNRREQEGADYLQYPYQTIAYRGGDTDDLAVLYAALLESVGTRAALIFLPEEVLVAFSVGSDEAAVRTQFSSLGDLLVHEGEFWAPLKVARVRDGFLRAWQEGAVAWKAALAAGRPPEPFTLAAAWKLYPPIGIPGVEARAQKPAEESLLRAFDNAMKLLVAREIAPKAKALQDEMGGGGTGRQRNSLGILYARFGMFPEARAEFEKAAALGYRSAILNLGNILFLLGDFKGAAARYQEILSRNPQDKAALIGLARAKYELDAFSEADDLFSLVRSLDPAFADRYAYLAARTDPTARAAAADSGSAPLPWSEGE
jgi:tetratricopeptide (TPR) repeat protein